MALADACAGDAHVLPPGCVLREHASAVDAEVSRVRSDAEALAAAGSAAAVKDVDTGLATVRAPRPLHYYALFGVTSGCDSVCAIYPGRRYELEHKYYGYVNVTSRPVRPRVALERLAAALNALEPPNCGLVWTPNSVVDSGPMLRLERAVHDGGAGSKASKADRYAHPFEREILASGIEEELFARVVASYFAHAHAGSKPRQGLTWADIHAFNAAIDWSKWVIPTAATAA